MPHDKKLIKNYHNKFILTLKDPAYKSVKNPLYTFHFGQVRLRALATCDNKKSVLLRGVHVCAVQPTESKPVEIGVKNAMEQPRTFDFKSDICSKINGVYKPQIVSQTCIHKYKYFAPESTTPSTYYMIIQPNVDLFERSVADLNIHNLMPEQKKAWEEADKKGEKEFIFRGRKYQTDSISPDSTKMMPVVELLAKNKFDNNLIMSLYPYESDHIEYVSFFETPSLKNPCAYQNSSTGMCFCDNQCYKCYNDVFDQVVYIPLLKTQTVSKACKDNKEYSAFDFSETILAVTFQNQDPSVMRRLDDKTALSSFSNSNAEK